MTSSFQASAVDRLKNIDYFNEQQIDTTLMLLWIAKHLKHLWNNHNPSQNLSFKLDKFITDEYQWKPAGSN